MDDFEDDDLHDQLMKTVVEYAKLSEHWDKKHSVRGYAALSREIRKVRKLAEERQRQLRKEKDRIWAERKANRDEKKLKVYKDNHLNFKKGKTKKS